MFTYDAFLSHNSKDKPAVESLAIRLEDEAGLKVFLDIWNLVPGAPWQEELEQSMDQSGSVVVFLGPSGIGGWHNEEMRNALNRRVQDPERRVIPVLLPNTKALKDCEIPAFLTRLTWVDFHNGLEDKDAFHRLIAGIRGEVPGRGTDTTTDAGQQKDEIRKYHSIAAEVYEQANRALLENQEALTPLLTGAQSPDEVYRRMLEIFHGQRSRGFFRRRVSYLQQKIKTLDDTGLRNILIDLIENVEKLLDLFYIDEDKNVRTKSEVARKISVISELHEETHHIETMEFIINDYLEFLRNCVENISDIEGTLHAMAE